MHFYFYSPFRVSAMVSAILQQVQLSWKSEAARISTTSPAEIATNVPSLHSLLRRYLTIRAEVKPYGVTHRGEV